MPNPVAHRLAGMADNSARIAQLRSLLQTGATSVAPDGATSFDPESLRAELRQLQDEDDAAKTRRPFAASILTKWG